MLALSLDLTRLDLILIGTGDPCLRRLQLLQEAGACALAVFSAAPSDELARAAGTALRRRWPSPDELRAAQLVFIADIAEPQRGALATAARAAGAIVHVEDSPALSDSHAPAVLRRGALTIAVATDGTAPGLAVAVKQFLATIIGPEWSPRVERMAALRQRWRRDGADHGTLRRLTAAQIGRYGWLKHRRWPLVANDRSTKINERESGGKS